MDKNLETVWQNCLSVIKDNVSPQNFKTWFEPIKALTLDKKVLTIEVPSQFVYEWLEEHYIDLLRKTVRKELGTGARLEYSILMENSYSNPSPYKIKFPGNQKGSLKNSSVNVPINIDQKLRNPFIIPGLKKVNIDSQLNASYTIDNFIEGDCNRLARSAAYAVAKKPGGTSFNPLLIYGAVGLGKTHLAHAIGIEIKNNFPNKTVLAVPSDKFINQFIDSVQQFSK